MSDSTPFSRTPPVLVGPELTIATAAHGNATMTGACIQAILQSAAGEWELILIDDRSPDSRELQAVYREASKHHANTRIYAFTENLEYSGSLNAVLSHATGRNVLFVSNDILITPHYLRALLGAAEANSERGLLRGSSNYVDNGLASHNLEVSATIKTLQDVFSVGAEIAARFGDTVLADPFLVGDAFLVTRPLIDRIGALDPWFYGYFADLDYGLRARMAGFELALIPGAFAYHHRHANFDYLNKQEREAKLARRWARVIENWARFKLKWGLPVSLPYEEFRSLSWEDLVKASAPLAAERHVHALGDYSRYAI